MSNNYTCPECHLVVDADDSDDDAPCVECGLVSRRWVVYLDDVEDAQFRTRREARAHAKWLRGHPACRDRNRYGHGGIVRVEAAS